jgi:menaquinol-cytochrome c reductase iron-sulfur subunit
MTAIKELMRGGRYARQVFLTGIVAGFGGIAGVVLGIPLVGYLLTPLINQQAEVWRDVGSVDSFTVGQTVEVRYKLPPSEYLSNLAGTTEMAGAWVRRDSKNSFTVYSMYCTHLGCPLHWIQDAELFLCPCHGSAFYSNGQVAAGPAEIPLVVLPWTVTRKPGRLMIKTSHIPVA